MDIGIINHPDKFIQEKLNHFYDYAQYLLSSNRDVIHFKYENHLTILEKLHFRAKNGLVERSSLKIVEFYLTDNFLFNFKDIFFDSPKRKDLLSRLKKVLQSTKLSSDFENILELLIKELNGEELLDGEDYFRCIVKKLTKMVGNRKPLSQHLSKLEYLTRLLLSEFIRVGFHRNDLIGNQGIFYKMLSNKVNTKNLTNETIYSDFPLPPHVEKFRGHNNFLQKIEEFLNGRTLDQQFEGLITFFKKKKNANFIIKIKNCAGFNNDFLFEFGGAKIMYPDMLGIDVKSWNSDWWGKKYNKFISEKNCLFAEVKVDFRANERGRQVAVEMVEKTLSSLSYASSGNREFRTGVVIDDFEVFVIYSKGMTYLLRNQNLIFSDWRIKSTVNNFYPSEFFYLPIEIQQLIKRNDEVLFKSSRTFLQDEKLSFYWRFLEGLFLGGNSYSENGKLIIKTISNILILREIEVKKKRAEAVICDILLTMSMRDTSLSYPEIASKVDEVIHNGKSINELKGYSKYPFLENRFDEYVNIDNGTDLKSIRDYYTKLLWETYEQRNSIFHQNINCSVTVEQLNQQIPTLCWRFRIQLLDKLIELKHGDYELTITNAIKELSLEAEILLNKS